MQPVSTVAYALDIGVYEIGRSGQVLSGTTAAWCRAASGSSDAEKLTYTGTPCSGRFSTSVAPQDVFACGRSIEKLAEAIASDVNEGRRVALGFEAPMWVPLEHHHRPRLKLFAPRFEAEHGSEWYLQSGAAATLKAIALGVMLREHLRANLNRLPQLTTLDTSEVGLIVLFEAFVVGRYKVLANPKTQAPDETDALVAALAWGGLNAGFTLPPSLRAVSLHKGGARTGPCLSVWSTIFPGQVISGPADCDVVALERQT